jgi:DNA-binding beta-propeller fold protein YncE
VTVAISVITVFEILDVAADPPRRAATAPRPAAAGRPTSPRPSAATAPRRDNPILNRPHGRGHLAPGSDPSVLPGPILIADRANNRLLLLDPMGRIRWRFPRPGDLGQVPSFRVPDDAFFSANGRQIVATQEDDSVISVINVAKRKILWRYGHPGHPGSAPGYVHNPDDALPLPGGDVLTADIKNCRVLLLHPGAHRPARVFGSSGTCLHRPGHYFGSPNGAFPMTNGSYLVTEISHDWVDAMSLRGKVRWSVHPPGVVYPSDTNQVSANRFVTVGYTKPGKVVEFNRQGKALWRYRPRNHAGVLDHPSLALPLPDGDLLVNDDYNDRVIVIDPRTNRIVWQYGHRLRPGSRPGYLHTPDGVDLLPPDSLMSRYAATAGRP